MDEFLALVNFILFVYMILVLIKPNKFMPFVDKSNGMKRLIAVLIWIVFIFVGTAISTSSTTESKETSKVGQSKAETVGDTILSNRIKAAKRDSIALEKGKVFDVDDVETTDSIILKAALYLTYTDSTDTISNRYLANLTRHNAEAAKKLWQKKVPQIRKKYAYLLKELLWEKDIDVKLKNNGKDIWFIGGTFVLHKNIKDFQNAIGDNLKTLGFHRAYYQWAEIEGAEYTYYTFD